MNRIMIVLVCLALLTMGACAKKPATSALQTPLASTVAETPAGLAPQTLDLHQEPGGEPASTPVPAAVSVTASNGTKLEAVYFDYDAYTLSTAARSALERNAAWLKSNIDVSVTIEGHCDERGSDEYNLALGERRAMAVRNYLTTLGVASGRLATVSYGEEHPAVEGRDESAWAKNRRVEFK